MKTIYSFLVMLLCLTAATAQNYHETLFHTGDATGYPYRIPAITTAKNGDVIALTDLRPCGSDIGYGRVDILGRISKDNGKTWGEPFTVIAGTGKGEDTGYGDACLVADRKRNELLLVCVSGDVPYWKSTMDHRQRMVTLHAKYDKKSQTWRWDEKPADLTSMVYDDIFKGTINGLFMGSGRICQSNKVKVGKYYRLYAALCTHKGNFVVYSDDFGHTWDCLGDPMQSCAPKGDEPKCEELPDGSVLLSSRKHGGRYFNVFHYLDKKTAKGTWGTPTDSREAPGGISNEGTPCNGEILIIPVTRQSDGSKTTLALQSIPAGPNRSNVTIYWKELAKAEDYNTPLRFSSNWQGSYQVSSVGSAYSTMTYQHDGRIGFFYEEEPQHYQMIYKSIGISDITKGQFNAIPYKKR